jgi:dynactin complex subunit
MATVPRVVLEIGSRVTTGIGLSGKKATVSFIGETQHSTGEWIGLTYDNPDGKNDGSQGGVSYFRCKPLHGAFVKRVSVKHQMHLSVSSTE